MQVINITLHGRIPSKKNEHRIARNRKTGARFIRTSSRHDEWHRDAMRELLHQKTPKSRLAKFDLSVWFYAPDRGRADATNKLESVNDLLVDYGVIKDDSWWNIKKLYVDEVQLDRENPRVEIEIVEVE